MQYNFVEFVKNINLYAIIDGVILLAIAAIMIAFFVYKRNVKMFIFLLAPIVLEILVFVLCSSAPVVMQKPHPQIP